ncbi:uncharacterized protein DUF4174 [Albidovulum inexpectatum]|uniref:Uncharacterized protein DUF4174 n=1 Tax=Albidovulum inexpectatum TaxID=196587 RepID=A0A2S5JFN1_9RHOB|nr:DUF4174 domain-containing protein [Albidovulum inexpectatum]PPB80316.1 uncharacterized protein DUF4174 [Albidovulum inexpectatum]
MRYIFVLALAAWMSTLFPALAAEAETDRLEILPAAEVRLEDFVWKKRPIVVFADSPNDPAFVNQMLYLADDPQELIKRDVVVIVDTDPSQKSAVREKLRPRGFSMVLLDKDGAVKLRKPLPWSVREIVRAIDKFPLRQQEIRDERLREQ